MISYRITSKEFDSLSKEIKIEFPTESASTYYVPFRTVVEEVFDPVTKEAQIDPKTGLPETRKRKL